MNSHLAMMKQLKEKSQERSLERYDQTEKAWQKFTVFVNQKINRPKTGISLIQSTDYYRESKLVQMKSKTFYVAGLLNERITFLSSR